MTTSRVPSPTRSGDAVGVGQAAQAHHAVEVGAGHRQATRDGAGGEQELVVPDLVAIGQPDPVRGPVDRGDRQFRPQFDVVLGIPGGVVDVDGVALGGAEQKTFGQRRPLVREFRLAAEQDDPAGESFARAGSRLLWRRRVLRRR